MMLIYKDEEIVLNFVLRVNGSMKKENKKENERRSKNQKWDHMQVHLDFHTHKPIAWSI